MLLIYSNPAVWEHPTFLQAPEALAMSPEDREGLSDQFGTLMKELSDSGELIIGQPLGAPEDTETVQVRDDEAVITDGPFTEAKEHLAGYFIVDCCSPERAREIASRFPDARFGAVEIRRILD
ncbi:YciI family protein [Actinomadura adrarensis]|uniref:YciI family protein n=1 Tax=Actinomadura adrarensis TaxID=1819600 RepID=A0ABW3CN21_9ACTN